MIKNFLLTFVVILGAASTALASSGGFRIFASDAEAVGKGGAFTGEADNPSAIIYNPAGLTQLKGENYVSVGGALISPMVDYQNTAGDTVQMRRKNFLVPHVYVVSDFNLPNAVFGVGTTSNFGLSTEWADDSFSRYVATRTDLENIDNHFTIAYRVNEQLSLGAGVIYEISKFNKEKNINQQPGSDAFAQLKGDDQTPGYTISGLYKFNPQHQAGLLYRSEIQHTYRGKATADHLNDLGTYPLASIFGGSSYATNFVADFTLPQSGVIGYSYTPNDKWRFNIDAEWMDWSSIENEKVSFPDELNSTRLSILDTLTASNRDWKSTLSYNLGTEYSYNEKLKLRGGYFFNPTPIPEANFDTAVPSSDCNGVSVGLGYLLDRKSVV